MATQRSEKKKKKAPAKKPPVNLKKKKKLIKPKPPKKKMIKKPVKPLVKTKTAGKGPAIKAIKDEKEGIRKSLLAMRDKLIREFSEKGIPEPLTVPSNIGDLVDQAGDERDRELSLLLTGRDKEKLTAINEALEKIKEGTYGICEECGEKIGQGRLKVMPLAKLCVSCQSNLEKEVNILKKTEEDLTYRGLAYAPSIEEEET